jgi:hypothetical protein
VAELRHAAATSDDPALRRLPAAGCARRGLDAEAVPHVASAHPDRWWGLAPLSEAAPLVGEGEAVRVSPSKVESFDTCSLRWFLESAVGVAGSSGPAQVVGSLGPRPRRARQRADALDEAALTARLDEVLPELDLGAPWMVRPAPAGGGGAAAQVPRLAAGRRARARRHRARGRGPLGERAVLAGRVDRLERDADGRAVVVDLKTGTTKPSKADLARHPQLGVYQLAVALGAFASSTA